MTRNEDETAAALIPEGASLDELREIAAGCRACHLWERGTQTVFGDGTRGARIVMVGEQPGDKEDEIGLPFVGPAGRVLERAMEAAGIERSQVYVTNVVKHFKWKPKGKRRIHEKPNAGEVRACQPWLMEELRLVRPDAVLLLGATAAQALLGSSFRVSTERGIPADSDLAPLVVATVHPSSILRGENREQEFERFARDLRAVVEMLGEGSS